MFLFCLVQTLLQFLLQNLKIVDVDSESHLCWAPNILALMERFETDILQWPFDHHCKFIYSIYHISSQAISMNTYLIAFNLIVVIDFNMDRFM